MSDFRRTIAAAACCLAAAGALGACGGSGAGGAETHSSSTAAKGAGAQPYVAAVAGAPTGGSAASAHESKTPAATSSKGLPAVGSGTSRAAAREVADPEEGRSFPAPRSAHHAAAGSPVRAGELAVAAGAASDAEVRAELNQMSAAQKSAQASTTKTLTPVPGGESIGGDGMLPIPSGVPEAVQKVVAGANAIADFPYVYGGGHASFVDNAYDCSGSVSYALAAAGLLNAPETSGELESWGVPGPGRYITVFANAGHTYMYVDGVLYDTAGRSGVYASRWQVGAVDNSGYVERHWPGL